MKRYVVGLGEALWDVLPTERKLGGAPANFAYHVARAGFDALVISAVGNDTLGDETLQCFKSKQLEYIMPRVEFPTGTVQVTVDAAGIPLYEIKRNVAWDHIPLTTEIIEVAKNCKAVCFGSLAQREDESRKTIEKFLDSVPNDCLRIFDINIRQQFYTKQLIENSLKKSDILKINDEELELYGIITGNKLPVAISEPWLGYLKGNTIIILMILQVMTVGSKKIGYTYENLTIGNHMNQVRHYIYGELTDTIETKTCHLVAHSAIGKTFDKRLLILIKVGITGSRYIRGNIYIHEISHKLDDTLVTHGCIDLTITT